MIVEATGPERPEPISEEFLRMACDVDDVHPDVDPYMPHVLPGGHRVTMGFLVGASRMTEARRTTLVDVLWFLYGIKQLGDPWVSPAPELQRCRILATGEPGGVYPALVIERREVGRAEEAHIVHRRSLVLVEKPAPTDWIFSIVARA